MEASSSSPSSSFDFERPDPNVWSTVCFWIQFATAPTLWLALNLVIVLICDDENVCLYPLLSFEYLSGTNVVLFVGNGALVLAMALVLDHKLALPPWLEERRGTIQDAAARFDALVQAQAALSPETQHDSSLLILLWITALVLMIVGICQFICWITHMDILAIVASITLPLALAHTLWYKKQQQQQQQQLQLPDKINNYMPSSTTSCQIIAVLLVHFAVSALLWKIHGVLAYTLTTVFLYSLVCFSSQRTPWRSILVIPNEYRGWIVYASLTFPLVFARNRYLDLLLSGNLLQGCLVGFLLGHAAMRIIGWTIAFGATLATILTLVFDDNNSSGKNRIRYWLEDEISCVLFIFLGVGVASAGSFLERYRGYFLFQLARCRRWMIQKMVQSLEGRSEDAATTATTRSQGEQVDDASPSSGDPLLPSESA